MEYKEYQFKTTLNCGGCVAKVQSDLDAAVGAGQWSVDTDNPDKTLTVHSTEISPEEVAGIVKSKCFEAELIR